LIFCDSSVKVASCELIFCLLYDSTNEGELTKEDKFVEEMKSDPDDNREVEPPKKGFL
jgi:hypothetical protein